MFQPDPSEFLQSLPPEEWRAAPPDLLQALAAFKADAEEARRALASVLKSLSGLFYRCELKCPWAMSFLSEGVEELTGYSAEEIERKAGWAEIMVQEDRARIDAMVASAVAERRSFALTYRIVHANGDTRWVSEKGHAVYGDTGHPLCLEGVITDISDRKHAEELQQMLASRWRIALDAIPQMVWTLAADGSDRFFNSQWAAFTGAPMGSEEDRLDLLHPGDRIAATAAWRKCFETGEPYEGQYRLKHFSGEYRWVLSRGNLERDANGQPVRWYGTSTDIHEQRIAQDALQASEAVNRSMIEASPDCISLLDNDGIVQFSNPASVQAMGLSSGAPLLGRPWGDTFPPAARGPARLALSQARAGRTGHFSTAQPSTGGTKWWDIIVSPIRSSSDGQTGMLAIARDITHQKTAEERVRWAANHDPLTQLPNRTLFQRALDQKLAEGENGGGKFSVLMLDLDDFKRTNDALGHDAGDALLSEFAKRLRQAVRSEDVVARLGGDEFAILLHGIAGQDVIEDAVASILKELKAPWIFDGKLLDIRTSIGACSYPDQGATRGELLKHADIALYVAKAAGRGVLKIFQPQMRAEAQQRMSMLSLAREALANDWIVPFYQPKVDLRGGRLEGFEALLRWRHPSRGVQTPGSVAAAFHDVTLAAEISDRMIDLVIADARRWKDQGIQFGHVAVNAAAAEFRRGGFGERLLERLHKAGLSPSCLQLEVTETVFLGRGAEHVEHGLKMLSAAGVQIALDDFGTGYASLSHLNHFPVDVIKIDRSFIQNLETSAHDAAIVRAVINLGRSLGIKIVAEGVETENQAAFLKRHRCHSGQGYLYGRPQPAARVPSLVTGLA